MNNQNEGISRLATAAENFIKQERWSRRWTNLLKLIIILYILGAIAFAVFTLNKNQEIILNEHIALIKLTGIISSESQVSAANFKPLLEKAFSNPTSVAVVIKANSPGGSPVQSALINNEITRLKNLYNKPIYFVVEDMCTSGCYYIAVAADKIYASQGSIIGSIGVRMSSFGFTSLMEKLGIENRSMHAGDNKTFIDPFSEKNEAGRKFFQERILDRTHQQFIQAVRDGRNNRIIEDETTFSGLVWLGDEALAKGLIDGLGDLGHIKREVLQVDKVINYDVDKSLIEKLMSGIAVETAAQLSNLNSGLR